MQWPQGISEDYISSVQFSRSVMSDSLRPHVLQHARPPCPSPTPGVHSDSRPSSQWCHPAISSSVIPFSSCSQSFPALGFFQWVNSSHEVAKVLEFQLQHQSFQWTPRTCWISLQSKGLSRVFSNTTVQKHQFFGTQLSLMLLIYSTREIYIGSIKKNKTVISWCIICSFW